MKTVSDKSQIVPTACAECYVKVWSVSGLPTPIFMLTGKLDPVTDYDSPRTSAGYAVGWMRVPSSRRLLSRAVYPAGFGSSR